VTKNIILGHVIVTVLFYSTAVAESIIYGTDYEIL